MALVTADQLVQAGLATAATAAIVAPALDQACVKFDISTPLRLAGFLAQCSHESCGFRVVQENLHYGAQALLSLFPKHFDAASAAAYALQQERIANRIYGGRKGNGGEATGDGWRFHGRGFIQLTFKDNYVAFDSAIQGRGAVLINPDIVGMPDMAALSAAWYWETHGLNKMADAKDIVGMTKEINGGTIGLVERTKLYNQALAVFDKGDVK